MPNDDGTDLGKLERKVSRFLRFMHMHLRTEKALKPRSRNGRWLLVRDWMQDCWRSLREHAVIPKYKRAVRRLQLALGEMHLRVRSVLDAIPEPEPVPAAQPFSQHEMRVVKRSDESAIFAQLMAMPRSPGQLLC